MKLCGSITVSGVCADPSAVRVLLTCPRGHHKTVEMCKHHAFWAEHGLSHCAECVAARQTQRTTVIVTEPIQEDII